MGGYIHTDHTGSYYMGDESMTKKPGREESMRASSRMMGEGGLVFFFSGSELEIVNSPRDR